MTDAAKQFDPNWPTCKRDRCTGIKLEGYSHCLAHLAPVDLSDFLNLLRPEADIDLRGTTLTSDLLDRLLRRFHVDRRGPDSAPRLGEANFDHARFTGNAWFYFAEFTQVATFYQARFSGDAWFNNARFGDAARFTNVEFSGPAEFNDTEFFKVAWFSNAQFNDRTTFRMARFRENAWFNGARFRSLPNLGPIVANVVDLDHASFENRVIVDVDAHLLSAVDARFEAGVELRVQHTDVDLQRTYFGAPSSVSGPAKPSTSASLMGPQLLSVEQADVSNLTVADMNLQWCRFAGAHQLDKLRLEGRTPFNRPPGWGYGREWPPVWRWSSRRVLAEEHPWRAHGRKSMGWTKELLATERGEPLGPERLAVLYRSLRKAFEDAKNEAGAGDFYYGEMEARRHASSTSPGERALLAAYWMLSGYGQRALRAIGALVLLVGLLFASLTAWGLPDTSSLQQMTGTVVGAQVTLEVKPSPATLPPPDRRWTSDRMSKAVRIALGSVVFRDSDQKLTPAGQWTVMAGRAFGPLLLALAALAVRARVKR